MAINNEIHMAIPWAIPGHFGSILVVLSLEISIDQQQAFIQCVLPCIP